MFRVECSSCKAPYQVDERRVPKKGLTMKCPKCQVSFLVSPPDAPQPVVAPVAPVLPRVDLRGTMIGVSAQSRAPQAGAAVAPTQAPVSAPKNFAAPSEARVGFSSLAGRRPARNDETMIGIAPERATAAMANEGEVPASDDLPARRAPAPLSLNASGSHHDANTKQTAAELPALKREAFKTDFAAAPSSARKLSRINLPSLQTRANPVPLPNSSPAISTRPTPPAPRLDRPSVTTETATSAEVGVAMLGVDDLPAVASKAPTRASDDFSFDLDLPTIRPRDAALPTPGVHTNLPAVAPSSAPDVATGPESDLPAALGGGDWTSRSGETAAVSLPPSFRDSVADLDSEGVSLESLPPSDPPSRGPDLPVVARATDLPSVHSTSGIPSRPSPHFEDAGLGFGELDLPPLDPAPNSSRPPVGQKFTATEPPDLHTSVAPPSFRARHDSFGDFDGLPSFDESSLRPPAAASSGGSGEQDEEMHGQSLSLDRETPSPSIVSEPAVSSRQAPSRRQAPPSGANQEYGEVNLEPGDDDPLREPDDEMEFGGIPQAESDPPDAPPVQEAFNEAERPSPAPVAVRNPAPPPSRSKSKRWVIVAAVVVPLGVGGAALSLDSRLGPFGYHAVESLINRSQHQQLLQSRAEMVTQRRALDQYASAVEGVMLLEQARAAAKRYVPLQIAAAEAHLSLVLRFGGPASSQSAGQVLLAELRSSGVDEAELTLAATIDTLLRGNVDSNAAIDTSNDVHALAVQGERWLRLGDAPRALEAWTRAVDIKRSPWTLFGAARAQFAAGQMDAAVTAAEQVLEANSLHAGAKLLLVEAGLVQGRVDEKSSKLLNEVLHDAALASPAELALSHTLRGEVELTDGRTGKALEALELALELEPKNVRALASSGRAMLASGRYTTALARYEAAKSIAPTALLPSLGVVRSYLALQQTDKAKAELEPLRKMHGEDLEVAALYGTILLAEDEAEAARKVLQQTLEGAPTATPPASSRMTLPAYQRTLVDIYVALAGSHTKAGQPKEATAVLERAMKQLPASAPLRIALGDVASAQGHFDRALAEYSEARQLAPHDVEAVFKVGSTLRRMDRFAEAHSVLERVEKMDAEYPGLALERGLLLEQSGKSDQALVQYEQALKAAPDDGDIQLRVGCGRMLAGNGAAAEEILEQLVKARPRSAEVNYCLGRAHFLQGDKLEALRWLRTAVELDGNRAEYRLYVGWVASELGQVPLARTELNRAVELDQSLALAYWQRGALNLKQAAARDAMYDFKKALELSPDKAEVNADMGQALTQLNREAEAIGYWEKAIAAEPDNAVWLFRYGKLLVGRHHNTKGAVLLRKAITLASEADSKPVWLWQAHYLTAFALKGAPEALPHWKAYLADSPSDSVFREEAKRELARAGQPWDGP